jgi:hypothetical protein
MPNTTFEQKRRAAFRPLPLLVAHLFAHVDEAANIQSLRLSIMVRPPQGCRDMLAARSRKNAPIFAML